MTFYNLFNIVLESSAIWYIITAVNITSRIFKIVCLNIHQQYSTIIVSMHTNQLIIYTMTLLKIGYTHPYCV